jgi:hypothetical protein
VNATNVASAGIDVSYGSIAPATEDRLRLAIVISCDPNREHRVQEKVALGPRRGQRYTQLIGCIENSIRKSHLERKAYRSRRGRNIKLRWPSIRGEGKDGKSCAPKTRKGNVFASWISSQLSRLATPLVIDRWSRFRMAEPPLLDIRFNGNQKIDSIPFFSHVLFCFVVRFITFSSIFDSILLPLTFLAVLIGIAPFSSPPVPQALPRHKP